jgi:hypothetical protein
LEEIFPFKIGRDPPLFTLKKTIPLNILRFIEQ